MANHRVELCFLLFVFASLSVVFFEKEGVDVSESVGNAVSFSSDIMNRFVSDTVEQSREIVVKFVEMVVECCLDLITFLNALKEIIIPKALCISVLQWLYHNSVQILLSGVIFHLIYNIHKESGINSKLMKELRIASNALSHLGWQVDVHSSEMNAIEQRLKKNDEERVPSILNKLNTVHDLRNRQQKLNDEICVFKAGMEEQINRLTILNQKLYGSSTVDNEVTRKIRAVGLSAEKRFEKVREALHNRIEDARGLLDETSHLLDIKGLPLRLSYDMEYEFH